ncbi:caltractin isoform X1 [Physcomitrium patens]|uniref:EF-hand domain-containing protein n=1 Tax=Physcomitrium patens TaxID=3218 RepID=A0A2K1L171_PHYPA|nr:caltractin-like [Physcomitrium patens]PNR59779.1 hypothetical protein PHYPA_002571 [Physcomitrium patens]|eukprot:XP_024366731.1 caltractin-like [Physcomitrella patens]
MATTNNQPQDFQRLRRPSWNPPSSTPSIPLGSRLGAYAATPKTVGKNDYFDLSYSEKLDIRLAFVLFDSRKFGKLNYKDLKAAIRGLECNVKKADVQKLMYQYSKENDGEIDSDEFLQIMNMKFKEKLDSHARAGKLFEMFDEEGRGKVSVKNLRKVSRDIGKTFTDEQLEAMIHECDMDGDGEVTEMEFEAMMTKHQTADTI